METVASQKTPPTKIFIWLVVLVFWFSLFECVFLDARRVQMGAPAGLQEQTDNAHCVWPQGQRSPSWDHIPCNLQVRKITIQMTIQILLLFFNISPLFIVLLGTTARSLWVTVVVESSAGPSATNQVVQQPTTGWRMRWWTAALAARFASPSLSDVTTAGIAGSSSAKSKSCLLKWSMVSSHL